MDEMEVLMEGAKTLDDNEGTQLQYTHYFELVLLWPVVTFHCLLSVNCTSLI